jgi:hypothetical protein
VDHHALKYIVNKPILLGVVSKWSMFFQEYAFEIFVKPRKAHVGLDHLSRIDNGEKEKQGEGDFPDANLFQVQLATRYLEDVFYFL